MEQPPVSERLPRRYRAVLDAVADLEAHGRRQDAAVIRTEATAAYSKAWNLACERRLTILRTRATRIVDGLRAAATTTAAKPAEARSRQVEMERTTA